MVGLCKTFSFAALAAATFGVAAVAADVSTKAESFADAKQTRRIAADAAIVPAAGKPAANGNAFVNRGPGCAQPAANCQEATNPNPNAYNGRSADHVGIAALNGDDFKVADNFSLPGAGMISLSSVCFTGHHGGAAAIDAGEPPAGAESFHLRILSNVTAGTPGTPDDAGVIADLFVGDAATIGYGFVITPGSTLTRNASLGAPIAGVFSWTASFPAVMVPANTCVWLEIRGSTGTVAGSPIAEGNRFRWGKANLRNPVSADDVFYQGLNSTPYGYIDLVGGNEVGAVTTGDRAFCLNAGLGAPSCGIPPIPANGSCGTAAVATVPSVTAGITTFRAPLNTNVPFCDTVLNYSNTVWYRVVGNGNTITASTCSNNTTFDTILSVFCGACGTLNCIGANDTGDAPCANGTGGDASSVSFPSISGIDYFIAVAGFQGDVGATELTISSDSTPVTPPACASDRCVVALPALVETETCAQGGGAAPGATGTTCATPAGVFTYGVPFGGTNSTSLNGTQRDFDFWNLNGIVPDNTGGAGQGFLDVTYETEFPVIFNFYSGPCAPPSNGTFLFGIIDSYKPCGPKTVQVGATAGADFRINFTQTDFGGNPCQAVGNNYSITVTVSQTGACCVPATSCFLTVQTECEDPTVGGRYVGNNTACCVAGSYPINPAFTICECRADYNGSCTVSVQDIFDFLSGYFSSDPRADVNSSGSVTVQDIFDFLSLYFTGC